MFLFNPCGFIMYYIAVNLTIVHNVFVYFIYDDALTERVCDFVFLRDFVLNE